MSQIDPPYPYDKGMEAERQKTKMNHCQHGKGRVFPLGSLVRNGRACYPGSNTPMTTPSITADIPRQYIYAVREKAGKLEMRVAQDGGRRNAASSLGQDIVKHESLFENADVLGAGQIEFRDGIVVNLDDGSGTYDTRGKLRLSARFRKAVLDALQDSGVEYIIRVEDRLQP